MEQEKSWIECVSIEHQMAEILDTNESTAAYGLTLSREQARMIAESGKDALRQERRVEFGGSISKAIILAFCDSQYMEQDHFAETVIRLQEIFYEFKNEMLDQISDDELLNFMREQFEGVCAGDVDYLEDTVLTVYAQAVRNGYDGFKGTDGRGEYQQFDEVQRWDPELYREMLKDLIWK